MLEGSNLDFHVLVTSNRCLEHIFKACHIGKYCDPCQIISKCNLPGIMEPTLRRTENNLLHVIKVLIYSFLCTDRVQIRSLTGFHIVNIFRIILLDKNGARRQSMTFHKAK